MMGIPFYCFIILAVCAIIFVVALNQELEKNKKQLEEKEMRLYFKFATFSPDGKEIVTGHDDSTVRIWDTESGTELRKLVGHTSSVCSAAFSPDGKRIVTASSDKTARIWESESGIELKKLVGHTDHVLSATFSPNGKRIVTTSHDKTARIWDSELERELFRLEGDTAIESASFSPDGKEIVTAVFMTVQIWDAESGVELRRLGGNESHGLSSNPPPAQAVSIPPASPATATPVSPDITAPSKPLWHYFDKNGKKIAVTVGQIKELARQGTIVPETILENPEGRTAPARKAKGLVFAEQTKQ